LTTVYPVVLSGGAGSRLWPLSRQAYPKQLLPLVSDRSLLEETLLRVAPGQGFAPPTIVANAEHRFVVAEQARLAGVEPRAILLETEGRNTAPAIAAAALSVARETEDAVLLVCPSDHLIKDAPAFRRAVAAAAPAAAAGRFMTIGIAPSRAETGYGWIEPGPALDRAPGCHEVRRFREKPDAATAQALLDAGALWNSGIFVFPLGGLLDAFERWEAPLLAAVRRALAEADTDLGFVRLDRAAFAEARSVSIDYAIMERAERVGVVPADLGWSDLGGFEALYEVGEKDEAGNVAIGHAHLQGSEGCYVRASSRLVGVLGMKDALVVETDDAVLVAPRARSQEIRQLVDGLKAAGQVEATQGSRWHRPWGWYRTLDLGDRFQVKLISVNPGASLSLQMHHHRAEHWIVVQGTARVTRDNDSFLMTENQSCYISLGQRHRLENPGRVQLELVEVQSGSYLGEDDIVRFEDHYGRN